jgi:alanyl-tRNA synthetase
VKSTEVRERFLSYFERRGHRRVPSSSLVPAGDPTLLFTNAGMNQFKDVFTGRETRDYSRATSAQKCVRAGGKHNDLDNVGYTARHHTFFEMLGNFSFGDYFKKEAIAFAWELVTDRTFGYGLDPERLWATVFSDDDEAFALWERYLPETRILRFGEKENFWAMGEIGPCGPCSEMHYYQGRDTSGNTAELVNGPGDGTIEIWNLVFMQYERDASGRMTPLPKPSVDTGAGLERIAAILQGVNNNFDTDLFAGILREIEEISGRRYAGGMATEDAPFRVIADHARAAAMIRIDGQGPSNTGRGDVVRKIMRRALRYGLQLGIDEPFLFKLIPRVVESFSGVYFEPTESTQRFLLDSSHSLSIPVLQAEMRDREEVLLKTITTGVVRVGEEIERLRRNGEANIPGELAFRLYDTYGVPLDLLREIAQDEGMDVDIEGFDRQMEEQRTRSQAAARFGAADAFAFEKLPLPPGHSEFRGYPEQDFCRLSGARVLGIVRDGQPLARLASGETGDVVTDRTVFYPEGGGQVADTGVWRFPGGEAEVLDTQKPIPGLIAHRVRVKRGVLEVGGAVDMDVPEWIRRRTQANHTGTHLLHAALRKVLGETTRQMGSLVAPDRLRFDYSSPAPLSPEQIAEIERLVNEEVLRDREVSKEVVPMEEARRRGAIAFFGEKYGERVRVVDVPGFSTELCGGCHVPRTGEIGAFKIISDRALASGVRRIEAVTSLNSVELLQRDEALLASLEGTAQAPREELAARYAELAARTKSLEKEIASLKLKIAATGGSASGPPVEQVDGVSVVVQRADGLSSSELRNLSDTLRDRVRQGVVVVGGASEGKTTLIAAVTEGLLARISASDLARRLGALLDGRGGGKPELAQAGGKDPAKLELALSRAPAVVGELLRSRQSVA